MLTETERQDDDIAAAGVPAAVEPERFVAEPAAAAEGERPRMDRGAPGPAGDDRPRRRPGGGGRRRRVCIMCADKIKVDYKNISLLRRFISDRARIETRRKTSCCAKHQRAVARAIKRARHVALLPYTPEHIRETGVGRR